MFKKLPIATACIALQNGNFQIFVLDHSLGRKLSVSANGFDGYGEEKYGNRQHSARINIMSCANTILKYEVAIGRTLYSYRSGSHVLSIFLFALILLVRVRNGV